MSKVYFEIEVGRLLCGEVRDFLKRCQFKGVNIQWIESSGLIERTFCIKGSQNDVAVIQDALEKYSKQLENKEVR